MDKNAENTYTNLKEYVYTYIRINRKITMAKNQLIADTVDKYSAYLINGFPLFDIFDVIL